MPLVEQRIWNPARRILGNLAPMILCVPFGIAGVMLYRIEQPFEPIPLIALALFPVIGWLATNVMGLWDNDRMRAELARRFGRTQAGQKQDLVFIGFSSLKYRGALDPHEDIGFLVFGDEELEIFGDARQLTLKRTEITKIEKKGNVHSLVGLGGWIAIYTPEGGVLIEPRERTSLLANKRFAKELRAKLESWLAGSDESTASASETQQAPPSPSPQ